MARPFSSMRPSGPGTARAGGALIRNALAPALLVLAVGAAGLPAQSGPPLLFERFSRHTAWVGGWRNCVAVGDLNGNGHLDMVMGSGAYSVVLLFNRGDATFSQTVITLDLTTGLFPNAVALGDLNGNGHLDLVVSTDGRLFPMPGRTILYLNDGQGRFTEVPAGQRLPDDAYRAWTMALGDVTGNGAPDLFIGTGPGDHNRLYLNDGRGFFHDATWTHLPADFDAMGQAVLADVTGNGALDLVLACGLESVQTVNRIYLNDGAGRFLNAVFLWPHAEFTTSVAVADLTGDGRLDLVFGNAEQQDRLYLNRGNGVFLEATDRLPQDLDWTHSLAIGDIDGDGHPDIVAGTGRGRIGGGWIQGGPRFYLNDGTGRFPTYRRDLLVWQPFSTYIAQTVHLADFDGDGDLDLFVNHPPVATWFMNTTRHLFTQNTVTLGGPLHLTFYGAPTQVFVPAMALEPAQVPIPGLGTLGLDPARLFTLPPVLLLPGRYTESIQLAVPSDPALSNRTLYTQALVVDPQNPANTRLTNWLADRLR